MSLPDVEPRWESETQRTPPVGRWVLIAVVVIIAALVGFTSVMDIMERRAIDYRSAEQIYALLVGEGFSCGTPFFPTGNSEPPDYSTATCDKGFTTVHIAVNEERGSWLHFGPDDYSKPWTSGAAFVRGRNWSVGFEAPPNTQGSLARAVQAILGGEIRHPLGQRELTR